MTLQQIMTWYLFITLSIVGAYDAYAILFNGGNATVSYELHCLGRKFPALYLFLGILIGHIVFPLHVPNGNNDPILPIKKE
jgi:hypothetical protein